MERSFVGDPINWPGLVYSPLNTYGLLFALGIMAARTGLVFEEFHNSGKSGVCRRETESGWERITVGLAIRSSQFAGDPSEFDLLICWIDDSDDTSLPKLELKTLSEDVVSVQSVSPKLPGGEKSSQIESDYFSGEKTRQSFEETIRQLDSRIKKLRGM